MSRKNALFVGHDAGAENWAVIASFIETCKLNGIDPHAWLTATLSAIIHGHKQSCIEDLMPWHDEPGAPVMDRPSRGTRQTRAAPLRHEPHCMTDNGPNLVTSSKSQRIVVGYPFAIEIHRLEADRTWTLEVVDHEGTSQVWEAQFKTDQDARNAAIEALEREGAIAFMRGNDVIPLRQG